MREPSEVPSKTTVAVAAPTGSWLRRFSVREDAVYRHYECTYQAKSARAKITYLLLYLVPGLFACVAINVEPIYAAELSLTHLSARNLQYAWILAMMCGWHMFVPFLVLRFADKLTLRESFAFLGLNRVDWPGLLRVLPLFCAVFALVSLPYIKFISPPLQGWLQSVPVLGMPSYSIFRDVEALYSNSSGIALAFAFIGNYLGEELYFHGYLMKKTAFLGRSNWIVNSILFGLYHLWQVPQTWPFIGMMLAFGLLMNLRKDPYVLIAFHFFANMWLAYGAG
jgi:hypothetical protein